MKKMDYKEFIQRNGYFISEKTQKKIRGTKLLFIGCGMASNVIESATRLGFTNFTLADGDKVELSNLNRQAFSLKDVGKNKAKAIEKRIFEINPDAKTRVIEKFIGLKDIETLVKESDIIINSADFDEVTYEVERISSENGKLNISPLNIGFGTVITAFNKDSARLIEITNGIAKNDKSYLLNYYKGIKNYRLPTYIGKNIPKIFFFIARKKFLPQNVIAVNISTSMILNTIIKYLSGEKIKLAPEVIAFDPEGLYEQST